MPPQCLCRSFVPRMFMASRSARFWRCCEALGYQYDPSEVFDILDWDADGDACLTYKELRFLDCWVPVEWLSATPDQAQAIAQKSRAGIPSFRLVVAFLKE